MFDSTFLNDFKVDRIAIDDNLCADAVFIGTDI